MKKGAVDESAEAALNAPPPQSIDALGMLAGGGIYFPHVESLFRRLTEENDKEAKQLEAEIQKKKKEAERHYVKDFQTVRMREVERMRGEVRQRDHAIKAIADAEAEFQRTSELRAHEYSDELEAMRRKLATLKEHADEAQQWAGALGSSKKAELKQLEADIVALKESHKQTEKRKQDNHDEKKRKMRDALVRKLRRARDALTTATADEILAMARSKDGKADGDGADDKGRDKLGASEPVMTGILAHGADQPTAKRNEQMARDVSTYEREAVVLAQATAKLEAEAAELSAQLQAAQAENAKLLLRNASHAKTRKILGAKVTELDGQLQAVVTRTAAQRKEQITALRSTVGLQSEVIDGLNAEIEHALAELLDTQRKLRATETARHQSDARVSLAIRFLMAAAADANSNKKAHAAQGTDASMPASPRGDGNAKAGGAVPPLRLPAPGTGVSGGAASWVVFTGPSEICSRLLRALSAASST